jgi:autotransporter-associated beta strand protein
VPVRLRGDRGRSRDMTPPTRSPSTPRQLRAVAAAASALCAAAATQAQTWNLDANGSWNSSANWTPATGFPNAVGASALLGSVITANRTVTLAQPVTLGTLTIDDNNNYTVAGTSLSFVTAGGSASLVVGNTNGNGAHTLTGAVGFAGGLVVTQGSTGTLTLAGGLSGAGGLVKRGSGTLLLNTTASSYGGATAIDSGQLRYGTGGAIPAASAVTVGDGVGAAASAQLFVDVSMSGAQALNVTLAPDGAVVQGNNRLVRLASVAGSGQLQINSTVGQQFEVTGTGGDSVFDGLVSGGQNGTNTDPNGGSRLAKSGPSTLALTGANTYVARTFVSGGSLRAANASALGTASAGVANATFVYGTGSLELAGSVSLAERLYLNGGGNGGAGALRSFAGDNTVTSAVTIGWSGGSVTAAPDTRIGAAAGSSLTITGNLDGSSALTKVGDGTVVLAGSNSHAGGLTVNAGVLRVAAAGAMPDGRTLTVDGGTLDLGGFARGVSALAGAGGRIALGGATLSVDQASDTAYAGVIEGSGSLVKSGAGRLTLAGANTYTGGTTVAAGVLAGDSTSLQGAIANAGTVVFEQANLGTFGGTIGGSGALVKAGPGTLVLGGATSHSGGTTVSAGTLQGNTATLQGAIANAGVVVFDQAGDGVFGGRIDGSGVLVKQGAGTLLLGGSNGYLGGTIVNAGTLRLGPAAAFPQATPLVVNGGVFDLDGVDRSVSSLAGIGGRVALTGATLTVDQATDTVYAGVVDGTGSLAKSGPGLLVLSADNAYAGATTVGGGTLQLGDGGSAGTLGRGAVVNDGVLVFNRADALTVANAIGGGGELHQAGTGTTRLTGVSTYSGRTEVLAGTLVVDGSIAASALTTVAAGARLAGSGTTGSASVLAGAAVAPGNSIGTLRVAGDYAQAGRYELEYRAVAPGTSRGRNTLEGSTPAEQDADLIHVAGAASLAGGSVLLQPLGSAQQFADSVAASPTREVRYLVLRADGGLGGTRFVALTAADVRLDYPNASDVELVLSGPLPPDPPVPPDPPIPPIVVVSTPPQALVAQSQGLVQQAAQLARQRPYCDDVEGQRAGDVCGFAQGNYGRGRQASETDGPEVD